MSARHRMSSTNKLIIKTCKNVKMLLQLFYSMQEMLVFLWNLASMLYFNGNQSVLRFVGFRCQAIHTDLMFSHINDHRPKLLVFCQNGLCLSPDPEQCQRIYSQITSNTLSPPSSSLPKVTAGNFLPTSKNCGEFLAYAVGAPRANGTGQVVLFVKCHSELLKVKQ